MKTVFAGGAIALALSTATPSAHAGDLAGTAADPAIVALGRRADAHGPAGTTADHVHHRGDLMIGAMWMHEDQRGTNRRGTAPVTDGELAEAGYASRVSAMTMDMAMLHVMWAPSERVTLMVAPSWMRMRMVMLGLPESAAGAESGGEESGEPGGEAGHGHHHGLAPGERMAMTVAGLGDTRIGAIVALAGRPALSAHAALELSVPTGSVTRRDPTGTYLHYGMQGGSGTWDIVPSLTVRGAAPAFGWGAQVRWLRRLERRNEAGFRFGHRVTATAWLSRPLGQALAASARVAWSDEGAIAGHYNGAHNHDTPPDHQENYGGRRLELGAGLNLVGGRHWRLGAEALVPVYQRVNGIQAPRRWSASLSASRMF